MAAQIEAKRIEDSKRPTASQSDASRQISMVQGIRQEIAAMLAEKKRGFSTDDYQYLGELGILDEDDRIELIEGEIVVMSPIGDRHLACVDILTILFVQGVAGQAIVRVQGSIRLDARSEPQPDIALLRPRDDFYSRQGATPEDVLLLVEVANSSLYHDRKKARESYAKHGIPELWIANLRDEVVERYRTPAEGGYSEVRQFTRGDTISPELLRTCC